MSLEEKKTPDEPKPKKTKKKQQKKKKKRIERKVGKYSILCDLHGKSKHEAMIVVHRELCTNDNTVINFVTGRGLHSAGGIPVLKMAVENYLIQNRYYYKWKGGGGMVSVYLKQQQQQQQQEVYKNRYKWINPSIYKWINPSIKS